MWKLLLLFLFHLCRDPICLLGIRDQSEGHVATTTVEVHPVANGVGTNRGVVTSAQSTVASRTYVLACLKKIGSATISMYDLTCNCVYLYTVCTLRTLLNGYNIFFIVSGSTKNAKINTHK